MSDEIPRLRMFAGPNGSGKSTLKTVLDPKLLGVYLNPDEMEREMRATGLLDVNHYGVSTTGEEATAFFRESKFLRNAGPHNASERVRFDQGHLKSDLMPAWFKNAVWDKINPRTA